MAELTARQRRNADPEARAQAMATRRAKKVEINRLKAARGCRDCPEHDPVCLQFHHRDPLQKIRDVCQMSCYSMTRIMAEIAKCDVLCANCHMKEEARLRG